MIVKIDKSEENAMRYVCALCDYKVTFFSIETNPKMVQAEITDEYGYEPTLNMIWQLGRQIEIKLACEAFSKR